MGNKGKIILVIALLLTAVVIGKQRMKGKTYGKPTLEAVVPPVPPHVVNPVYTPIPMPPQPKP